MANNSSTVGSFIPTTQVWDVAQLYETEVNSPEFKELLVRMYQQINNIAVSINTRDAGYYDTQEFVNGQLLFPNPALNSSTSTYPAYRQIFRIVINFGALPNTATKSVPHGITITPTTTFTRIYGTANDTTGNSYIHIPYSSATAVANNIELNVDATNVNITTGSNRTNYTITYVVLEYVQS